MSKEYRYRGKVWVILAVVIVASSLVVVSLMSDKLVFAILALVSLLLSWLAVASVWVRRVVLEGHRLEVFGLTGKSKVIQLDEPFEFWEAEGEALTNLMLSQGRLKVMLQSTLEDFEELKKTLTESPGARPPKTKVNNLL